MSAFLLRKNIFTKGKGEQMKAFLILEDGTVFTGTSIGSTRDMISEIVFNTSMTGYLEVLTDPSYAGQAVVMTYPLIGNYGITPDMESLKAWPDGYIVRELSRMPSNFRCEGTIQDFLKKYDIPGIAGVDTRALTKILREKGTMNGMITTNENYDLDEVISKLKNYIDDCLKHLCHILCDWQYSCSGIRLCGFYDVSHIRCSLQLMVNIYSSVLKINVLQRQSTKFRYSHSRMKEYVHNFIVFTVHHIVMHKL